MTVDEMRRRFDSYGKASDGIAFGYAYDCGFIYGGFSFVVYESGATAYMPFQSPFARSKVLNGPTLGQEDVRSIARAASEAAKESGPDGERRKEDEKGLILDGGTGAFLLSGEDGAERAFERRNFDAEEASAVGRLFRLAAEILGRAGMNVSPSEMTVPCRRVESFSIRTETGEDSESRRKGRVQTLTVSRNGRASLTIVFDEGSDELEIALDGKKTDAVFDGIKEYLEGHEEVGPKKPQAADGEDAPSNDGTWELTVEYADGSDETFFGKCSKRNEEERKLTEILRRNTGLRKKLRGMTN